MKSKEVNSDSVLLHEESVRLRGTFQHALDDKGRISVPSTLRQELLEKGIGELVITNAICDGARCLEGFTLPDWKVLEQKLSERGRFDPQVRKLENYYLARAAYCAVDKSGRISVPQHLRNYAGFEREVVFTPSVHGFRIWDKRVWEMVFALAEAALLENPELFAGVDK